MSLWREKYRNWVWSWFLLSLNIHNFNSSYLPSRVLFETRAIWNFSMTISRSATLRDRRTFLRKEIGNNLLNQLHLLRPSDQVNLLYRCLLTNSMRELYFPFVKSSKSIRCKTLNFKSDIWHLYWVACVISVYILFLIVQFEICWSFFFVLKLLENYQLLLKLRSTVIKIISYYKESSNIWSMKI